MKLKNNAIILFLIYFIVIYGILTFLLLNSIATPLISLWEFVIKNIFKETLNYAPFVFVPICSGVISISIYISIVFSSKIAFKKILDYTRVLEVVLFMWFINLLRLVIVLGSEKISLEVAKTTHILSWFVVGVIILYLSLKTFKER